MDAGRPPRHRQPGRSRWRRHRQPTPPPLRRPPTRTNRIVDRWGRHGHRRRTPARLVPPPARLRRAPARHQLRHPRGYPHQHPRGLQRGRTPEFARPRRVGLGDPSIRHPARSLPHDRPAPPTRTVNRPLTIVGGGLAGLSLGIALRNRGIPVVILEAGTYPRHRVCGEFICGVSPLTLEKLGIAGAFEPQVTNYQSEWFYRGRVDLEPAPASAGDRDLPTPPRPVAGGRVRPPRGRAPDQYAGEPGTAPARSDRLVQRTPAQPRRYLARVEVPRARI